MKILIAEDDATSRTMLTAMLTKWGYEVVAASDGNEAWELLQKDDAPQLVIFDWMMPGMDGIEVCRKLRQEETTESTHIIMLTIRGGKEDTVTGLNAGANDYIAKPYDNDELRARVEVGRRIVELRMALEDRIKELEAAFSHIKKLQGILPICMKCHKIRNDKESWERIEKYIEEHSDAQFSHGLCPDCAKEYSAAIKDEQDAMRIL